MTPREITIDVAGLPPAKNEALSLFSEAHGQRERVCALLVAARGALPQGYTPIEVPVEMDVVVRRPGTSALPDATNLLGGIADVLEEKGGRRVPSWLGDLAGVAVYRNDRQLRRISYREEDAVAIGYTIRLRPLASEPNEEAGAAEPLRGWTEEEFAARVLAVLREFDVHIDLASAKENAWSRSIRDHFRASDGTMHAIDSAVDRAYPGARRRFDVRLNLAAGAEVYVEAKGAWKTYWIERRKESVYTDYLFSPLGGVRGIRDSAADALRKLATLTPDTATHVALLIVGSARVEHAIGTDLDHFESLARLGESPWRAYTDRWPNPRWDGHVLDVRLWIARRAEIAPWWELLRSEFDPDPEASSS